MEFVIEVEGLRIELTGKFFDLLLINDVGSARKALPDVEVIEIEPIVDAEFLHGQCFLSTRGCFECPSSLGDLPRDRDLPIAATLVEGKPRFARQALVW